ncbi:hypothetical protein JCM8115_002512 [Rhodotorula mucilaginosa]
MQAQKDHTEAISGQEEQQVPTQPPPASKEGVAAENGDPPQPNVEKSPNTGAAESYAHKAWGKASVEERQKISEAIRLYNKAAGFEDGPNPTTRARIIHRDGSAKSVSATLLREAARGFLTNEIKIPANELRLALPARVPVKEAERRIYDHYSNNGALPLPATSDWEVPAEAAAYVSPVVACAYSRTLKKRDGAPTTHLIKVAFSSEEALHAARLRPFSILGSQVPVEHAPPSDLAQLVELRFRTTDLAATDANIVAAAHALAPKLPSATLAAVVRHYDTTIAGADGALEPVPHFNGNCAIYMRLPEIVQDDAGLYKSKLGDLLPNSISYNGDVIPLRHAYETGPFCPRCRFVGHAAEHCSRFPCSSCSVFGHTADKCTNPTGRKFTSRPLIAAAPVAAKEQEWQTVSRNPQTPAKNALRRENSNLTPVNTAARGTYGAVQTPTAGTTNRFAALDVQEAQDTDFRLVFARDFPPIAPTSTRKHMRPTRPRSEAASSTDQPSPVKRRFGQGPGRDRAPFDLDEPSAFHVTEDAAPETGTVSATAPANRSAAATVGPVTDTPPPPRSSTILTRSLTARLDSPSAQQEKQGERDTQDETTHDDCEVAAALLPTQERPAVAADAADANSSPGMVTDTEEETQLGSQ